jgi:molybdate transport system substrate-binding protein
MKNSQLGRQQSNTSLLPRTYPARIVLLLLLGALAFANLSQTAQATSKKKRPATPIIVAAASDLRPVFELLANQFTKATGVPVTLTFAGSTQLKTQILNGAPFDVFASASEALVDEVGSAGLTTKQGKKLLGYGHLVLVTTFPSPKLMTDLSDGDAFPRVAIANPKTAPYGIAAQQALESAGVYKSVEERLVIGENVSDTYRLLQSGNVSAAIVALSLVKATPDQVFTLIDTQAYKPLRQSIVVLKNGHEANAAKFVKFVTDAHGREAMSTFGFTESP